MSREIENLRHIVSERLTQAGSNSFYGYIENVNEEQRTCRVKVGEIVYDGVLLYTLENPELKGLVVIPAAGSGVIVSRIGSSNRLYVEMFSTVDKILLTIGEETALTLDVEGVDLKVDQAALTFGAAGMRVNVEDKTTLTTAAEGFAVDVEGKSSVNVHSSGLEVDAGDNTLAVTDRKIEGKVGGTSLSMDSGGFSIKTATSEVEVASQININGGGASLGKILTSLCQELMTLTVPTPMGPSGPPLNMAQFAKLLQDVALCLKQ